MPSPKPHSCKRHSQCHLMTWSRHMECIRYGVARSMTGNVKILHAVSLASSREANPLGKETC